MKMVRLHGLAMIIELVHVKMVYFSNIVNFLLKFSLTKKYSVAQMLWNSALLCTSQTLSKSFFRLAGADSDFEKIHQWEMQAIT
jgi:hypothetical protein